VRPGGFFPVDSGTSPLSKAVSIDLEDDPPVPWVLVKTILGHGLLRGARPSV